MSKTWLEDNLQEPPSEYVEDYLFSRGMTEDLIHGLRLTSWTRTTTPIPDPEFTRTYGVYGQGIEGWLVHPLYAPQGTLLGFDARDPASKRFFKYRTPRAKYHPVMGGIPFFLPQIWSGMPVVLVEGLFDLAAMSLLYQGPILSVGTAKPDRRQVEFLSRWSRNVIVCLDMDAGGRLGTEEAVRLLTYKGIKVTPLAYRFGKDPNEVWVNRGLEGLGEEFPSLTTVSLVGSTSRSQPQGLDLQDISDG